MHVCRRLHPHHERERAAPQGAGAFPAPFPAAGQPERFSPAPGRRRGPGGTAGPFPPLGFRMVLLPSRPVAVPATAVATATVAAGSSSRIVSWAVAVARSVAAGGTARTTAARVTGAGHAAAGLAPMAAPTAGAALAAPVATTLVPASGRAVAAPAAVAAL